MRSQKISPRRRPLPGGAGRPKFNQLETVTTFTYRPSLVNIDAHNFEYVHVRPQVMQVNGGIDEDVEIEPALAVARDRRSMAKVELHSF